MTKAWISPEQWRESGEYFPHRNQRIFYRRSRSDSAGQSADGSLANRPTLLLLHGFPTSSWDWSPLWETLTPQFHVIAPDLLGYGFSAKPADYEYRILDQADLCEALLSKLGVSEYHVLAHDYGDTVAQELLARALDDSAVCALKSICFLNGGLFPEAHRATLVQRLLLSPWGSFVAKRMDFARFSKSMQEVFGAATPASRAEMEAMWSMVVENNGIQVMHKLIGYIPERKQFRPRWVGAMTNAHTANIPLRLINGADDPVSGRHMAKRYADLVPGADIMLLNGIGHYPQIEAPDEVLRGVIGFHETRVVKHRAS